METLSMLKKKSVIYPPYTDIFKAKELRNAHFSIPYNFPLFKKANVIPKKLIPFDKIFKAKEDDYDAFVHFFLPDVCFERFWKSPAKYITQLKKFAGCFVPDFSVCYDFPYPLQLYNCYKNRILGYILDYNQIQVIMNVCFGDSRSYDFCCNGIEHGGVIATGSLGTIKNPDNRKLFTDGLSIVLNKLRPSSLILYGMGSDEIKELCKKFNVELHLFSPQWNGSFITKEILYG